MAHAGDKPQGTPDFDTRLVFLIGLIGAVLFFIVIVAIWAGFEFVWTHEVYEKQYRPPYPPLVETMQQQRAMLDGSQGGPTIDAAMQQVVEQAGEARRGD